MKNFYIILGFYIINIIKIPSTEELVINTANFVLLLEFLFKTNHKAKIASSSGK